MGWTTDAFVGDDDHASPVGSEAYAYDATERPMMSKYEPKSQRATRSAESFITSRAKGRTGRMTQRQKSPSSPKKRKLKRSASAGTSRSGSAVGSTSRLSDLGSTSRLGASLPALGAGRSSSPERPRFKGSPKKKKAVRPARAAATVPLIIRAHADTKSKRVGSLFVGSVVYVVEKREVEGTRRVFVALRDNAPPTGWVTAARDGETFLEIEGGAFGDSVEKVGGEGKEGKDGGKPKQKVKSFNPEDVKFSVADLEALVQEQMKAADAVEEEQERMNSTLHAKVGEALLKQKAALSVAEYLQQWDLSDVTKVSKMEFRRSVRQLVPSVGKGSSADIDVLFDGIDTDHSGSLDMPELVAAFKKIKDEAKQRGVENSVTAEKAARLRRHADTTRRAAAATAAADAADADLASLKTNPKIEIRLGNLLAKRGVKIGDIAKDWDADGSGTVDKKEFREHIRGMGLEATDAELDGLFKSIDEDGGGSLELPELVSFLKKQHEQRTTFADMEKAYAKKSAELRKAAKQAQLAAYREKEADEAEAAAEEAAREKEREKEMQGKEAGDADAKAPADKDKKKDKDAKAKEKRKSKG